MTDVLVADYDFPLYRGDTGGPWVHKFNDNPLDWQPATAYTVGDLAHDSTEVYVAHTTVTRDGVSYTCKTAHTSGSTFDATLWTKDVKALGPETDITGWTFLGQYRVSTDPAAELLASDTCEITDGPGGEMTRTLSSAQAELLVVSPVFWDLQATRADDTVKTFLKKDRLKVGGDVSRVVSP